MDVVQFRCPKTGEWKPGWGEAQKAQFVEALVDVIGDELDVDTGNLSTGRMRNIVNRVRFFVGEYKG
jgi:hypothetical protein